jgi:hypothetical protein
VLFVDRCQALAQPKNQYLTPTVQATVREFLAQFGDGKMIDKHLLFFHDRIGTPKSQVSGYVYIQARILTLSRGQAIKARAITTDCIHLCFCLDLLLSGPTPNRESKKNMKANQGKSEKTDIFNAASYDTNSMNRLQQGARYRSHPKVKEVYCATIQSIAELGNSPSNSSFSKMLTARPDVILAITDNSAQVAKELRNFFEREHGTLIVTVTKKHINKAHTQSPEGTW